MSCHYCMRFLVMYVVYSMCVSCVTEPECEEYGGGAYRLTGVICATNNYLLLHSG